MELRRSPETGTRSNVSATTSCLCGSDVLLSAKRHHLAEHADDETDSARRVKRRSLIGCKLFEVANGSEHLPQVHVSPRSEDLAFTRPPSTMSPEILFPNARYCSPPLDSTPRIHTDGVHEMKLKNKSKDHQCVPPPVHNLSGTSGIGMGYKGEFAITPPYDPICIGFFASKKSPSPQRPHKPLFPKCLSVLSPNNCLGKPSSSLAHLRRQGVAEDKAELLAAFHDARREGSIVVTSPTLQLTDPTILLLEASPSSRHTGAELLTHSGVQRHRV